MKKLHIIIIFLLVCSNLATIYFYTRETLKIKNGYMPSFQEDFLTHQLSLTQAIKEREQKGTLFYELESGQPTQDIENVSRNIPLILQNPDYPNGCEAASATMLLNYKGIDISLKEFIDSYLPQGKVYEKNGKRYGPNPSEAFAGDPGDIMYGWGTLEPTIKNSLNKVVDQKEKNVQYSIITNDNRMSLDFLLTLFSEPFIIWITVDYSPVKEVYQWYSYDGKNTYTYTRNSHTVVVTGYDKEYYYVNDPLKEEPNISVKREILEKSFDSAGRQAIAILKQDN